MLGFKMVWSILRRSSTFFKCWRSYNVGNTVASLHVTSSHKWYRDNEKIIYLQWCGFSSLLANDTGENSSGFHQNSALGSFTSIWESKDIDQFLKKRASGKSHDRIRLWLKQELSLVNLTQYCQQQRYNQCEEKNIYFSSICSLHCHPICTVCKLDH